MNQIDEKLIVEALKFPRDTPSLTTEHVRAILGYRSQRSIQRMIQKGILPCHKATGLPRYVYNEVLEALNRYRQGRRTQAPFPRRSAKLERAIQGVEAAHANGRVNTGTEVQVPQQPTCPRAEV